VASAITKKRPVALRAPRAATARRNTSRDARLKDLMKQAVREVLIEEQWLDPDAGLPLRPEFVAELQAQERRVASSERDISLEQVMRKYGVA
jgi:hypothetical protein